MMTTDNTWSLTSLSEQANAYLIECGPARLLLDAGTLFDDRDAWWATVEPDWVWLSHVHHDHAGAWPLLLRHAGRFSTSMSAQSGRWLRHVVEPMMGEISPHLWQDMIASWRHEVVYDVVTKHDSNDPSNALQINGRHYASGHVHGASALELDMRRGEKFHRVLYLSDFCLHDQPLLDGARPQEWLKPDTLIIEGALAHQPQITREHIADNWSQLKHLLAARSGGVLLTPDAWGMLHSVLGLCEQLEISPMVHDRAVLALPSITWPVRRGDTRQCKDALRAGDVVVVPGTQMTHGGASHQVVLSSLGVRDATVVVFNQPQSASLAHALLNRRDEHVMFGQQRLMCQASVVHVQIANHAPLEDLVRAVMILQPARVVLVHGTKRGLNALRRQIKQAGFEGRVMVLKHRHTVKLPMSRG